MSECNSFTDCKYPRAHASPLQEIHCRGVSAAAAPAASIGARIFTTTPDISLRQCFALSANQRKGLTLHALAKSLFQSPGT
jgi:hypothetical protein